MKWIAELFPDLEPFQDSSYGISAGDLMFLEDPYLEMWKISFRFWYSDENIILITIFVIIFSTEIISRYHVVIFIPNEKHKNNNPVECGDKGHRKGPFRTSAILPFAVRRSLFVVRVAHQAENTVTRLVAPSRGLRILYFCLPMIANSKTVKIDHHLIITFVTKKKKKEAQTQEETKLDLDAAQVLWDLPLFIPRSKIRLNRLVQLQNPRKTTRYYQRILAIDLKEKNNWSRAKITNKKRNTKYVIKENSVEMRRRTMWLRTKMTFNATRSSEMKSLAQQHPVIIFYFQNAFEINLLYRSEPIILTSKILNIFFSDTENLIHFSSKLNDSKGD